MKLRVGDKVIEQDGIITLVYTITQVRGNKALAESEFEGKKYPTAYKSRYTNPDSIQPWRRLKDYPDLTIRKVIKHHEHSQESK